MSGERGARLFAIGLVVGIPLALLAALRFGAAQGIELHGRMAEAGGWTPADLTARVGEPLRLRLTSDDVVHGFAVGQQAWPGIEVKPGQMVATTLTFDRPGKYTFYCTRWCGPNHWRMRGTIEVSGPPQAPAAEPAPLYVTLGLDIDAPHPAAVAPDRRPSAVRGAALGVTIPPGYLSADYYRANSPSEAWQALKGEPAERGLSDAGVWDLVAHIWSLSASPEALVEGARLYAANCAACHGETGGGDGVMAASLGEADATGNAGHSTQKPVNFTDAARMLGASPAVLQGKIIRGGMGTGMPYWGPIFTDAQTWALVAHLYTFQMEFEP